jgi:hypothetical protein
MLSERELLTDMSNRIPAYVENNPSSLTDNADHASDVTKMLLPPAPLASRGDAKSKVLPQLQFSHPAASAPELFVRVFRRIDRIFVPSV